MYFLLIAFSVVSCETAEKRSETAIPEEKVEVIERTLDENLMHHIREQLEMNAIDKFDYAIYKQELNGDDSTDWIITVNLLDRAINDAVKSDKTANMATFGFMGQYNYFIFMDGATKKFSPAVVVPSSAYGKLDISFEHLSSLQRMDIIVDLKIANSRRKKYYTITNNIPFQEGEEVVYDDFGKDGKKPVSFAIEYALNKTGTANNILVYEGIMAQQHFDDPKDVYATNPSIKATNKLVHKWYFHPVERKYYMRKDEL